MEDLERIVHQLVIHNNWEVIDEIDNSIYIYVFYHLPPKYRAVIDLKSQGRKNEVIANRLNMSNCAVRTALSRIKRRLVGSMFGLLDNSDQYRLWKSDSKRHKRDPKT